MSMLFCIVHLIIFIHNFFHLILILIRTLEQPHITHKSNGQLQESECTIIHFLVKVVMVKVVMVKVVCSILYSPELEIK